MTTKIKVNVETTQDGVPFMVQFVKGPKLGFMSGADARKFISEELDRRTTDEVLHGSRDEGDGI